MDVVLLATNTKPKRRELDTRADGRYCSTATRTHVFSDPCSAMIEGIEA